MGVLSFVRNKRAVLKIAKRWPANLPAPIYAADNEAIMRAKSILAGMAHRDGSPHCDLTAEQARDVVRWCRA